MHAASEDLRICRFKTGTVPRRVFDVQIAAGLVGFGYPLSLVNLIGQARRITVSGGETRTDWRRRALSPAQLRYALDDVRYLLDLADLLSAPPAQGAGAVDWAEGEFAQFVAGIQNRVEEERWAPASRTPSAQPPGTRSRPKAGGVAVPGERGGRIARSASCSATTCWWRSPSGSRRASAISKRAPRLQPPAPAQPGGRASLAVIASAQLMPHEHLPEPPDRHDDGPGLTMVVNLLAAALAQCCAQAKVAAGLVGTSNDLKDLVRWHSQNCPEASRPDLAEGWRAEVCGKPLLDACCPAVRTPAWPTPRRTFPSSSNPSRTGNRASGFPRTRSHPLIQPTCRLIGKSD